MVGKSTFSQVPINLQDQETLRRFLSSIVEQINIAFGNIGDSKFADNNYIVSEVNTINGRLNYIDIKINTNSNGITSIQAEDLTFSKLDGSRPFTNIVSYNNTKTFTSGSNELVDVTYSENTYEPKFSKNSAFNKNFGSSSGTVTEGGTTTNNPQQAAIAQLTQTISSPPTQAEVQAIQDKVNSILTALGNANII